MNIIQNAATAIEVSHVTKRFRLSSGTSLKTAVIDTLLRRKSGKEFTALDDVDFTVSKGETLGIIGHNGAGKSTLLSIIARTLTPSAGKVRTVGTVSSLLELGAGFHPDLTGRENVMLYGAVMGIPQSVMRKKFDEIVEFAGIREFIDQPVRFYSSGMYVRLGFSVAVQVDPDILLVDEVLAVGDTDFQTRCLERMDAFRKAGKTLLLISHDIATIRRVSDRIAYLSHGKLIGLGDPQDITTKYQHSMNGGFENGDAGLFPAAALSRRREWGIGGIDLEKVGVISDANGQETFDSVFVAEDSACLRLHWVAPARIDSPVFGFSIEEAQSGRVVYGENTQIAGKEIAFVEGRGIVEIALDLSTLQFGEYTISLAIHSADHLTNYCRKEALMCCRLVKKRPYDGICRLACEWKQA